jgi:hypothetical protein
MGASLNKGRAQNWSLAAVFTENFTARDIFLREQH